MADVPRTDWDMLHHWEWFRRSLWQDSFRSEALGSAGGICRAFADLSRDIKAEVALDCACGLGRASICLAEMGLNVLGSDLSPVAIRHARALADQERSPVTFFESAWSELPRNIPHYFDAVLCDSLALEPQWDKLGASIVGIFHSLRPGGFLMFLGAGERSDQTASKRLAAEEWAKGQHESVEWLHREGALTCARLRIKLRGSDYIDNRYLHVIQEGEASRLESTIVRQPFYWNWIHWQDLTRVAGFCHIETRTYGGLGRDGAPLEVNVAWKSPENAASADDEQRRSPYLD